MYEQQTARPEKEESTHTIRVACYPDSLAILIKADMFGVGAPVDNNELHLGVEDRDSCRATVASRDEYKIVVGLMDCGTKHWVTENLCLSRCVQFVFYNLTIYGI